MLFWISVTKQLFENGFAFPYDQKYPRYPLVLKLNVTLARPLCLVILYFFKFFIVHSIYPTDLLHHNKSERVKNKDMTSRYRDVMISSH